METEDFLKEARRLYAEIVEEEKIRAEVDRQIEALKRQQRDLYNTYLQAYKECPSESKTPVTELEDAILKRYNTIFYRPDLSQLEIYSDLRAFGGYIRFKAQDVWNF